MMKSNCAVVTHILTNLSNKALMTYLTDNRIAIKELNQATYWFIILRCPH